MLLLFAAPAALFAQRIEYGSVLRHINQESYFRFHYDNDYFTKTDRYYSQGITLEYVHPGLRKFPLQALLIKPQGSRGQFGITASIFGFTPTSIEDDAILYGDRPFAAAASLGFFSNATDTVKRRRIHSAIGIWMFGPVAQGKEIQTGIHKWLNNKIPLGWQHQIHNDILLTYRLGYEKQLYQSRGFLVNGMGEATLGTCNNLLSAGLNMMTGHFNDPYAATQASKKLQYYFYAQARGSFVAYDAMLQGGLFNRSSPYTIASRDISRLVFRADAGLVLNFRKLFFTYTQSFLTREFSTGVYHRWGGVSLGLSI